MVEIDLDPWEETFESEIEFDSIATILEEDELQLREIPKKTKAIPKSSKKYVYSSSLIDISKLSRNGGIHRPIPSVPVCI